MKKSLILSIFFVCLTSLAQAQQKYSNETLVNFLDALSFSNQSTLFIAYLSDEVQNLESDVTFDVVECKNISSDSVYSEQYCEANFILKKDFTYSGVVMDKDFTYKAGTVINVKASYLIHIDHSLAYGKPIEVTSLSFKVKKK